MAARQHDPDAVQMSFGDHLEELRRRVIYSIIGFFVASLLTLYYGRDLIAWICQPLIEVERFSGLPAGVYNFSVLSGFTVYMKVGMVAAVIISGPWIIYQLWKFVEAGLYPTERRVFIIMAPISGGLTIASIFFLYYFMLPATLVFLMMFTTTYPMPAASQSQSWLSRITKTFMHVNEDTSGMSFDMRPKRATPAPQPVTPGNSEKPVASVPGATLPGTNVPGVPSYLQVLPADPPAPVDGQIWLNSTDGQLKLAQGGIVRNVSVNSGSLMTPLIGINEYLNLVVVMALVVAISFQIPVFMGLLAGTGLVNPSLLARYRRYIFFGFFVLGIFITPSQDLFSDVALPLMMYGLFELGLLLMRVMWKKQEETTEGPMGEA